MMKAGYDDLRREVVQIKRRISALEKALDSMPSPDDLQAIEDAREDLRQGRTAGLQKAKKRLA